MLLAVWHRAAPLLGTLQSVYKGMVSTPTPADHAGQAALTGWVGTTVLTIVVVAGLAFIAYVVWSIRKDRTGRA
jgi:hypothetical protein